MAHHGPLPRRGSQEQVGQLAQPAQPLMTPEQRVRQQLAQLQTQMMLAQLQQARLSTPERPMDAVLAGRGPQSVFVLPAASASASVSVGLTQVPRMP